MIKREQLTVSNLNGKFSMEMRVDLANEAADLWEMIVVTEFNNSKRALFITILQSATVVPKDDEVLGDLVYEWLLKKEGERAWLN